MRKIIIAFVAALGVLSAVSCTVFKKTKPRPETVLAPVPYALDVANYSKQLNAAFAKKARELNAAAAYDSDTSLTSKHAALIDTLLINSVNQTVKRALVQLCDKCGASALFKQDSLSFIEIYGRGYCNSYTLYVVDKANKGVVYQRRCSQAMCRPIKVLDISLLLMKQEDFFDGYNLLYVRSKRVNNAFLTERK